LSFLWDYDNLTHIAEHGVSAEEAEQVLNCDTMLIEYQNRNDEERFMEIGVTHRGRFLIVVFTSREEAIRVVTAYDPTRRIIEEYLKNR
jgi:uncharacterized DUF497 family protein